MRPLEIYRIKLNKLIPFSVAFILILTSCVSGPEPATMAAFSRVEYRPVADKNTPKEKALTGILKSLFCPGPINSLNYPTQKNNLQIIPLSQ